MTIKFDVVCSKNDTGKYPLWISEVGKQRQLLLTYIYVFDPDAATEPYPDLSPVLEWPGISIRAKLPQASPSPWPGEPPDSLKVGFKEASYLDTHKTEVSIWIQGKPGGDIVTLITGDVPNCGWPDCIPTHFCKCETCVPIPLEMGKIHQCLFDEGLNLWTLRVHWVEGKCRICSFDAINQDPKIGPNGYRYIRFTYNVRDNLLWYRFFVNPKPKVYPPGVKIPPDVFSDRDDDSTPSGKGYKGKPLPINQTIE